VVYSPANMAKPEEIEDMMTFAEEEFGGIDILANNAGIRISEEAVVRDVLLAAQPTKRFIEVSEIAAVAAPLHGQCPLDHRHGAAG
jgi:NAD(P)-dependent dehydrogenase (short-subunit alcohol dehydrogenase family)